MANSVYHAVGYVPYLQTFVSFGIAPTKPGAEALLEKAAKYSRDLKVPVRCAVLEFQINTTVFRNSDGQIIDVVLQKSPDGEISPVDSKLADGKYTDIAPFGSHPGRFA